MYSNYIRLRRKTGFYYSSFLKFSNQNCFGYVTILSTSYGPIWELSYNGGNWITEECSQKATTTSDFIILCQGNGRNDGICRIYAWGESGLYEFSYENNDWACVIISNVTYNYSGFSSSNMVLADGRNDGYIRLYTADNNGAGEYTYTGSWSKTGLLSSDPAGGIAVGNGRNDSGPVNRVYATSGTHVYEYTAQAQ